MFKPLATYRIQFHHEFTFNDLKTRIPYLKDLGIDTIYASPIFEAIPKSTHGYDVVNPLRINPEIGTEEEFRELRSLLHEEGINWIQDIVPNHMAFHSTNKWLMDVLAKWDQSPYFHFFDFLVDEKSDEKLLLPFLGEPLTEIIESGKLKIIANNGLFLAYGDHTWPLNHTTAATIESSAGAHRLDEILAEINENPARLTAIVQQQHYLPAYYEDALQKLNYRRFFTVNELICLRMEDEQVFDHYHQYLIQLYKEGLFQGFRIDHIDGLAEPETYLQRLRSAAGPEAYIVVEKILGADEQLPENWPMQGATGYEFMAALNQILTANNNQEAFDQAYLKYTQNNLDFDAQSLTKKRYILNNYMQSELNYLAHLFGQLFGTDHFADEEAFKQALSEFLIHIPVYRYYFDQDHWYKQAYEPLVKIARNVKSTNEAYANLLAVLFATQEPDPAVIQFLKRCMQFAGPLTAKGVEDTLFYTFNRNLALNEVGSHPHKFGTEVEEFHEQMRRRAAGQPYALNATSTHDTKRGEDARARLFALSANPTLWSSLLTELVRQKLLFNPEAPIHPNDAYQLLQSLFATLPLMGPIGEDYQDKILAYWQKALRESKKRSSWESPDEAYETASMEWIKANLQDGSSLVQLLREKLQTLDQACTYNSLAQATLKATCPGIPDYYQGSESWNFSLVDPDNRKPVDYEHLQQQLKDQENQNLDALTYKQDGPVKLRWTQQLLTIRNKHPEVFLDGDYDTVTVKGKYKDQVLAFVRSYENQLFLIVVPICMDYPQINNLIQGVMDWQDTVLVWPDHYPNCGENLLNQTKVYCDLDERQFKLEQLTSASPIAIVQLEFAAKRASGVLAHISSLPSAYGIGALGSTSFRFVDFLASHKQRYWQLLPLNPTTAGAEHSPYSSYSAFAGNPLFIALESLANEGWLTQEQLESAQISSDDQVDYQHADTKKHQLLEQAYKTFTQNARSTQREDFKAFCRENEKWLHDFALFQALSANYETNWDQWPKDLKFREPAALKNFADEHAPLIGQIKWTQYVFFKQWQALRKYAKQHHINLIGDLPFYVAHHSAEVWANPTLFELDANECPAAFAGAPPDALSEDGQNWGMPLYRWKERREQVFEWWGQRLAQNLKLFDSIRLDHFRAFHSYWAIPQDGSAKNGVWKAGPQHAIFDFLRQRLHKLPFIAEDLGTAIEEPMKLRSALDLPGMKVIQFGLGLDYAYNENMPHQYKDPRTVVYLGTHDNNTIKGWYTDEADRITIKRLERLTGHPIHADHVHEAMIRFAHASIAELSIVQLQDIFGLGSEARMNTPGTTQHNWLWRASPQQLNQSYEWLIQYTEDYGRI